MITIQAASILALCQATGLSATIKSVESMVVLLWLGSGLNKHVNFGVYLFLTGLREVTEPSDTSTANYEQMFGAIVKNVSWW